MFKLMPLDPQAVESAEASYHERRDLAARQTSRGPNINRFCTLAGGVDPVMLRNALQQLVLRHDALRTRFERDASGAFRRRVEVTAEVPLVCIDLRDLNAETEAVKAQVRQFISPGFSTDDFPLMRVGLLNTAMNESVVVVCVAELIADGQAVSILFRELSALYEALQAGRAASLPTVQYQLSEFAAAHTAWMKTADYEEKLQRVREKLHHQVAESGGIQTLLFAPTSKESFLIAHEFSDAIANSVSLAARTLKVSLPSLLMAVAGLSILRAREASHLFFTSTFSNRHIAGIANMVGHLATTMPCLLCVSPEGAWRASAQRLHRDLFSSMSQFGMIPISEIAAGFGERYAPLPAGANIKFGKVVMDVTQEDQPRLFGLESRAFVAGITQGIGALYKFSFQASQSGGLRLWLRGLKAANNEDLAQTIVDTLIEDTLKSIVA